LKKWSGLKFRKLEPQVRSAIAFAIAEWKCGPQNGPQKCSQHLNALPGYASKMWSAYSFCDRLLHRRTAPHKSPKGNMRRLYGPHIGYAIAYPIAYLTSNSTNTLTHFAVIMRSAYLICDRILDRRITFSGKQYFLNFYSIDQYKRSELPGFDYKFSQGLTSSPT